MSERGNDFTRVNRLLRWSTRYALRLRQQPSPDRPRWAGPDADVPWDRVVERPGLAAMEPLTGLERTVWHECAHLAGHLSETEADRVAGH